MLRASLGVQRMVRGGGHAVDHAEDFELGFELVGDEVDGDVGVSDCVFYGESEGESADAGLIAHVGEVGLGLAQVRGHYVFEDDVESGARYCEGEAAAGSARSDDSDGADGWVGVQRCCGGGDGVTFRW